MSNPAYHNTMYCTQWTVSGIKPRILAGHSLCALAEHKNSDICVTLNNSSLYPVIGAVISVILSRSGHVDKWLHPTERSYSKQETTFLRTILCGLSVTASSDQFTLAAERGKLHRKMIPHGGVNITTEKISHRMRCWGWFPSHMWYLTIYTDCR